MSDYKDAAQRNTADYVPNIELVKLYDKMNDKTAADTVHANIIMSCIFIKLNCLDVPRYREIAARDQQIFERTAARVADYESRQA